MFENYVKEIKPTAITFDSIPKSLDLTTVLKYFKEFELSKLMKPGEISKTFKRLAVNGLWLSEASFLKMHDLVFEIPETVQSDL